ncbi:MAG TPA: hypothetical protein VEE85_00160 [Candidatus Bathyarchaeia archaeon]|nr:hypothetical protein [Candidatus Bathyarchaeia archaeon]
MATSSSSADCMCAPVRNRYFYGKLLDVFHFEMEQNYFNDKRRLLNRLISGYGVVCGLNVTLGSDGQSVVVSPGVAIDKCGREIIVCQNSDPFPLPPPLQVPPLNQGFGGSPTATGSTAAPGVGAGSQGGGTILPPPANDECNDTGVYKHLCICYHECPTDPSPALGGDCDNQALCTPGSIREKYCLKLCDGRLCPASTTSSLPTGIVSNGALNYGLLASYITNLPCCTPGTDCCIALANIQIPAAGSQYTQGSIEINIRPLVYTADLLYELMLAWMSPSTSALKGGK